MCSSTESSDFNAQDMSLKSATPTPWNLVFKVSKFKAKVHHIMSLLCLVIAS